ncbi:MAG: transposase domain-containing protein, partial [Streptosporangiaceae bacterium]
MSAGAAIDDAADVAFWRERAERAEDRLAGAEARVLELAEQVAVLSRMLFGQSSEKAGAGQPGKRAGDDGPAGSGRPVICPELSGQRIYGELTLRAAVPGIRCGPVAGSGTG